jgi:phosphocarrier protein HPr
VFNKKLAITNKLGLHARAASVFVKTASTFSSTINVSNQEKESNGKGEDETEAMAAIEALVNDKFGESE